MWLDLLLILLAVSPLMHTTRFLVRNSASLYARGDEEITRCRCACKQRQQAASSAPEA